MIGLVNRMIKEASLANDREFIVSNLDLSRATKGSTNPIRMSYHIPLGPTRVKTDLVCRFGIVGLTGESFMFWTAIPREPSQNTYDADSSVGRHYDDIQLPTENPDLLLYADPGFLPDRTCLTAMYRLSVDELLSMEKYVDWFIVSLMYELNPIEIDLLADKLDWAVVSAFQVLSESLILRHSDKLEWRSISSYQDMSAEFMKSLDAHIHWDIIARRNSKDNAPW